MTLLCLPVYFFWAAPRGAWAIATVSAASVSLYTLWLTAIWIRRQGSGALTGLTGLGVRAALCSLPGAAAALLLSDAVQRNVHLPPPLTAILALAAGGCAFVLLFLPLARLFAPGILEPLSRRLRGTS